MLHRTTWVAIPVLALVLAGSGFGWWGYNQFHQRQALATQSENQYAASFHGLVGHMNDLEGELGKACITGDSSAFQARLRDIWRLSYAAQTEVGRLPFDLMPMHHTQRFLSSLSSSTEAWMTNSASPNSPVVHKSLQSFYTESKKYSKELGNLQETVFNQQLKWSAVSRTIQGGKGDNQIIDGFRHIDTQASVYVESKDSPTTMVRGKTFATQPEPDVGVREARAAVAKILRQPIQQAWKVSTTGKGAYRPEYIVEGQSTDGPFRATVSKDGGHVMSLTIDATVKGRKAVEFADAQETARLWLQQRGFPSIDLVRSNQFDHSGYFVFSPTKNGAVVLGQAIAVHVNLAIDKVVGYDASNYYDYPLRSVPARKYSAQVLQKRINPAFHIEMVKTVVVLNDDKQYVPAVAFYGTSNDETYCIYVNAVTGRELNMEQLS